MKLKIVCLILFVITFCGCSKVSDNPFMIPVNYTGEAVNFNKENLLPNSIFIYKNVNLVKTILYEKINMEEL